MLESLLINKSAIQNCLPDDRFPLETLAEAMRAKLTGDFWQTHEDLAIIAKAIAAACIFVEADSAALSSYAGVFLWLAVCFMTCSLKKFSSDDRRRLVSMLRRRLYGWHDPRDRQKRVTRSFHHCLA